MRQFEYNVVVKACGETPYCFKQASKQKACLICRWIQASLQELVGANRFRNHRKSQKIKKPIRFLVFLVCRLQKTKKSIAFFGFFGFSRLWHPDPWQAQHSLKIQKKKKTKKQKLLCFFWFSVEG